MYRRGFHFSYQGSKTDDFYADVGEQSEHETDKATITNVQQLGLVGGPRQTTLLSEFDSEGELLFRFGKVHY